MKGIEESVRQGVNRLADRATAEVQARDDRIRLLTETLQSTARVLHDLKSENDDLKAQLDACERQVCQLTGGSNV